MPADLPPWIKRGAVVAAVDPKRTWFRPVRVSAIGAKFISTEEDSTSDWGPIKDRYSRETLRRSPGGYQAPWEVRTLMPMDEPLVQALAAKQRRGATKNAMGPLLHQWEPDGDPTLLRQMIDLLSEHLGDAK